MVSIVRGFLVGVSLTRGSVQSARRDRLSCVQGLRAHAGAPVVRDHHLADPAREPAVRRARSARRRRTCVRHLVADHARRDERAARAIPGERQLALPLARQRDVARRRLALERGRHDVLASPRAWRDWSRTSRTAPASHGAAASGTAATATTASEPRSDARRLCAASADGRARSGEHGERREHAPDVVGRDLPARDDDARAPRRARAGRRRPRRAAAA